MPQQFKQQQRFAAAGDVVYTMTPSTGRTLTTPTGAELGAAFTDEAVGTSFKFSVVNLAAATHAVTLTAGASGVTLVGDAAVAAAIIGFVCWCVSQQQTR
jgi:hypothetical protein